LLLPLLLLLLVPWSPAAGAVLVPAAQQGPVQAKNEQLVLLCDLQGLLRTGVTHLKQRAAEAGPGERGLLGEHTRERCRGCGKHLRHYSLDKCLSAAY
jgi:hypothetical protein